jgi:hypothetical protein
MDILAAGLGGIAIGLSATVGRQSFEAAISLLCALGGTALVLLGCGYL